MLKKKKTTSKSNADVRVTGKEDLLQRKASAQRRTQECRPRTILRKNHRKSGDTPSPLLSILVRVITIAKTTWEGKG